MKRNWLVELVLMASVTLAMAACTPSPNGESAPRKHPVGAGYTVMLVSQLEKEQTPNWSADDRAFFLHGSMSTEFVPEDVLRAFVKVYPDLFGPADLSRFGLIADDRFGWPVGVSRAKPAHLGGLSSVGVNCAACHVAEVALAPASAEPADVRVLGVTSHFDAEAFYGAVITATFLTSDPANMKKFLAAYIEVSVARQRGGAGPATRPDDWSAFEAMIEGSSAAIEKAIAADPAGEKGAGPGGLQMITGLAVASDGKSFNVDVAALTTGMLKLFHNMRAALHVPDHPEPSAPAPPPSGPGRNDAFGLLSLELFGVPQPHAPVKFGVVWNVEHRPWVHWDGNTRSPIGRNILASVGLGAPLVGHEAMMDFALVKRQTDLSEQIRAPKYPWPIDRAAAARGAPLYAASCASCHDSPEGDGRLYAVSEVGTDPVRATAFTQEQADRFNTFLAELKTAGYTAATQPGIRGTGKYWAASLAGAWARSPYLHNGSVRTMKELLTAPAARAATFHRGTRQYDATDMGYRDAGPYPFDTKQPGNANTGHDYGTGLSDEQKRELIEYLKTL